MDMAGIWNRLGTIATMMKTEKKNLSSFDLATRHLSCFVELLDLQRLQPSQFESLTIME